MSTMRASLASTTAAPSLDGTEKFFVEKNGVLYTATAAQVAALASGSSRTLAVSSFTGNAGGGSATPGTGTLTLGSGIVTSSYSDTPSLFKAHGGSALGLDAYVQLKGFSGPGTRYAQATFGLLHKASALSGLQLRVYSNGQFDLIAPDSAPTALFTKYVDNTLANDGQDWLRLRVDGGNASLFTARGASSPGAWKLWWTGPVIGSGLTCLESDYPNVALRLDAQSGVSGAVSVQWGDVTLRDL